MFQENRGRSTDLHKQTAIEIVELTTLHLAFFAIDCQTNQPQTRATITVIEERV